MARVGIVYTHPRAEERMLLEAGERVGVTTVPVHDADLALSVHEPPEALADVDAVIVRSLSLHRALAITATLERWDIPVWNRLDVAATCGDKWRTSLALAKRGVPTPQTMLATSRRAASGAAQALGFPVVSKPLQGSWARLLARCNDADALEAIVEHREVLGHPGHQIHYLQAHVDKPGRDLRAFVMGHECVAAIRREADHWVTNTARGAVASRQELTKELVHLAVEASRAVGGGLLAVDLMEGPDGLVVHEVNATMEFRNSVGPTGVDIPGLALQHVAEAVS